MSNSIYNLTSVPFLILTMLLDILFFLDFHEHNELLIFYPFSSFFSHVFLGFCLLHLNLGKSVLPLALALLPFLCQIPYVVAFSHIHGFI